MTLVNLILSLNAFVTAAIFIAYAMRPKNMRFRVLTRDLATNDHQVYYVEARDEQEAATLIHDLLQDDGINSIILKVTLATKPKGAP